MAATTNGRVYTIDLGRRTIFSEANLIYLDWITGNRDRVTKLSNGRLGYVHVPDMGAEGIYEFIKWYYGQIRKEGLVVDVRANGGGNVSRMLIERLSRKWLGLNYGRTDDQADTYPDGVFIGPQISILNEIPPPTGHRSSSIISPARTIVWPFNGSTTS